MLQFKKQIQLDPGLCEATINSINIKSGASGFVEKLIGDRISSQLKKHVADMVISYFHTFSSYCFFNAYYLQHLI